MSHFMDQGGIQNQYDSTSTLKGSIERTVYKQPSWSVTNRDTSKIAVIGTLDKSSSDFPTSMNTFEKRELVANLKVASRDGIFILTGTRWGPTMRSLFKSWDNCHGIISRFPWEKQRKPANDQLISRFYSKPEKHW